MKPLALALLCTSIPCALAQVEPATPATPEPIRLGLTASVTTSLSGNTKLKTNQNAVGEASSADFDHSASYARTLPNGATLTVGHNLHGTFLDLPERNTTIALPDRLLSAQAEFSYMQSYNDRWSLLVAAGPGLRWADSDTGSKAFGVTGAAGAIYRPGPTWTWMFGVGCDSLAHHKVLPGIGMEWTPSEHWSVSIGYPKTAVTYRYSAALSLALVAEGISNTYHIEKDPLPGAAGRPSLADTKLEYNDYRAGLAAEYHFSGCCTVRATAGCVVAREFDYFERDLRLKSDGTAAYGSLSLALAF